jgi:lysyl-tRNA synthetase class 2
LLPKNWRLASRHTALELRTAIVAAVRSFFVEHDYLEVETPQRIPAPAPELHIDAVPADGWFLQTSPELCMKRLLAAGYPRIFQICHCWRNGERGRLHVPEFTILEWYRAGGDYFSLMDESEAMVQSVACRIGLGNRLTYQGKGIELGSPWRRLSVREAFAQYAQMTVSDALGKDLFDEIMVQDIEPHLGCPRPTFLYDYPAALGALARLHADDPSVAERCELYIAGLELANGFSELTDAEEQRNRFDHEEAYRRAQGKRPYPTADRFLDELQDMPPSAGIALGMDRLVMLFHDAATIDDVLAFPPEEL